MLETVLVFGAEIKVSTVIYYWITKTENKSQLTETVINITMLYANSFPLIIKTTR